MERRYFIQEGKDDVYLLVSQHVKKDKITQEKVYEVDLRNQFCKESASKEPCKGFWYKHKCIHLTTVLDLLKAKKIAVFHHKAGKSYYSNYDFQDLKGEKQ